MARALAVFGMVVVNFKIVMGADSAESGWIGTLVGLLDGWAAATFVVLAGVGISLLSMLIYSGFWTASGMIRHLLFNGSHPVILWLRFLLVGMAVGRLDLARPEVRQKTLRWSVLGAVVGEGVSPRKASLVLYLSTGPNTAALLKQLGKHKTSVACLYINKLADVDPVVLESLIEYAWSRAERLCDATPLA